MRYRMINFRKAMKAYLNSLVDQEVYFMDAPDIKTYPYAVYSFEVSSDGECEETILLDIDGWDEAKDTTALETMMANLDGLDKHVINTVNFSAVFYRENRLNLKDESPRLKRRRYTYSGKMFEKGEE